MTQTLPRRRSSPSVFFSFLFFFFLSSVRTARVRDMMHMAILSASPAIQCSSHEQHFMMVTVFGHDIAVVSCLVQIGHSFNVNELLIQYK